MAQAPVYAAIRGDPIPAFGWIPFEHPKNEVRKQISRLDAETGRVHFADGSHLDNVDHILFGTGYTFSFPFLPHVQKRVSEAYRRLPGVWQHTWDIEDPSLAFVGMVRTCLLSVLQLRSLFCEPIVLTVPTRLVEGSPFVHMNTRQWLSLGI